MLVADKELSLLVSGGGDVMEMGDVMAIGSGGDFALACARGLLDIDTLDAEQIARKAMTIAASLCIYTNHNLTVERIMSESDSTALSSAPVADLSSATIVHQV
jgi:ATP-dependent HslUV protease subunit HslV